MKRRLFNFLDNIRDTLIRLLIGLAAALFVALATIVLLAPDSVRDFIDGVALGWRILLLLVIYGIAGVMVYQEFVLGGRANIKGLIVKGESGSVTELDVKSVESRVKATVQNLSGINEAKVNVKSVRGKAQIDVSVTMQNASVNIPDKQREITRALQQLIEKQLGIRMAEKPHIDLAFSESAIKSDDKPASEPRSRFLGRSKPEPQTDTHEEPSSSTPSPAPSPTVDPVSTDTDKPTVEAVENPLEQDTDDKEDDPEFWTFLKSTEEKKDQ